MENSKSPKSNKTSRERSDHFSLIMELKAINKNKKDKLRKRVKENIMSHKL